MSFFSLFTTHHEELSLILDIGSGSVGASVVFFNEPHRPKILYTVRKDISISEKAEPKKILDGMMIQLKNVLLDISEIHKNINTIPILKSGRIRKVHCLLSSPWYVSMTKTLKLENAESITFSKKLVDDILKKEEIDFEKSIFSNSSNLNSPEKKSFILERKIIQAKLNGYETTDPYSQKARIVEVSIFIAIALQTVVSDIENAVHRIIGLRKTNFNSFPFATYSAVRDIFSDDKNFAFMDVSSEVTDLTIVKNGAIIEAVSFPVGKNTLVRDVMEALGVPAEIAVSYLKMHSEKVAGGNLRGAIDMVINGTEKKWENAFSTALTELSHGLSGISKIFVTIDSDVAPIFEKFIKKLKLNNRSSLSIGLNPIFINEDKLHHFVSTDSTANTDAFLALETVFLRRFEENK